MTGNPGIGLITIGCLRSVILVTQASPFFPLIFMASDPQTPSLQDIRIDNESSIALILISKSNSMTSVSPTVTS